MKGRTLVLSIALLAGTVFPAQAMAQSDSNQKVEELQKQLDELRKQMSKLEAQLGELRSNDGGCRPHGSPAGRAGRYHPSNAAPGASCPFQASGRGDGNLHYLLRGQCCCCAF